MKVPCGSGETLIATQGSAGVPGAVVEAIGSPKQTNYFIRYWKGELSLGASSWSGSLLAMVLLTIAGTAQAAEGSLAMPSAVALVLLALVTSAWHGVGLWRSTTNHIPEENKPLWVLAAEVMTLLGFLGTSGMVFGNFIPRQVEFGTTNEQIARYEVRVLPGGTEIEFRGALEAGSAKRLAKTITAAPKAKVLHIESPGGRICEAKEMMDLVRERHLSTSTSERCLGAATLLLLSSKDRIVGRNAMVGFHNWLFPGITEEQEREANGFIRTSLQSAGLSEPFIDRVLATPPDRMWYPTFEEMRQNGLITNQL